MLCDYSFSFIFFGVFLAFYPRSFLSFSFSLSRAPDTKVNNWLLPTHYLLHKKKASPPIKCTECVQHLILIAKLLFAKCDFIDGVSFKMPIWISRRVLSHTLASLYIWKIDFIFTFSPQIILNEISSQLVLHVFQWNISIEWPYLKAVSIQTMVFLYISNKQTWLELVFRTPFLLNLFLICDYELERCAG